WYIAAVGGRIAFLKIHDGTISHAANGRILHGVPTDTVIEVLMPWELPVSGLCYSLFALIGVDESGKLEEAFGTGTAAVISPIGQLTFEGNNYVINDAKTGSVAKKLYDTLTGIQYGHMEDPFNWITKVSE